MEEPFIIKDDQIDVAAIMAKIREQIRKKREQGLYSDEEVAEMTTLKLQAFADEAEIDSELLARLLAPNHNWNISVDYRIQTHRPGWKGAVIVWLKKAVRPFVRLYSDHLFNRQAQLNLYMVHLCHNVVRELTRLQVAHTTLKNRCDQLERELDFLTRREKTLETMVEFKPEALPAEPQPPAP